ncbi:MAG: alpha/beta fold hydrolase [Actinomycetota bacterium]
MRNTNETRVHQVMPEPTTTVSVSAEDELDVWVMGEGAPVVFVHGGVIRDLLEPVADELASRGGYQVIHYGRRGYGGTGLPAETADIPEQATDVVTILDALGVDRAHVAGHSFGAYIALELATRAPDRLLSAMLLEPVFAQQVRTAAAQQGVKDVIEVTMPLIVDKYTGGDTEGAVATFCDATSGLQGAMELIEPALPKGARELAGTDLNTFLQVDLPAMGSWTAEPSTVRKTTTPIAWIGCADNSPAFVTESRALLQQWLPATKAVGIAGAGHYFPVLKPADTATALDELVRSQTPAR